MSPAHKQRRCCPELCRVVQAEATIPTGTPLLRQHGNTAAMPSPEWKSLENYSKVTAMAALSTRILTGGFCRGFGAAEASFLERRWSAELWNEHVRWQTRCFWVGEAQLPPKQHLWGTWGTGCGCWGVWEPSDTRLRRGASLPHSQPGFNGGIF